MHAYNAREIAYATARSPAFSLGPVWNPEEGVCGAGLTISNENLSAGRSKPYLIVR